MTASEVASKKGAVLTIQRYEFHMSLVLIDLSDNTMTDKVYRVARVNDEVDDLTSHQLTKKLIRNYGIHPKHFGLELLTYAQMLEKIKETLVDFDYFFIWNRFTLKMLTEKLSFEKKNVFFITYKLEPVEGLICGCCYAAAMDVTCSAAGAMATMNYFRNFVKRESFPADMMLSNLDFVKIPVVELQDIVVKSVPFVTTEHDLHCIEGYARMG